MSNATLKADIELKLDECITAALDSLLKNYPPTDEFKAIFQEKMFVKSNTKAFIHVSHYLFTVLDEKEFKKRFYWPIKCKADENHFRSATVEYINHLITIGKLKMDKIKAMHVVIPGGIKFMKFLLKVIVLVVNEVIARKKPMAEPKKSVGEYMCKELLEKNDFVTSLGVELKKIVAEDISAIQKKTEMIDMAIGKVFANVPNINSSDERMEFFENWALMNSQDFKKIQQEQGDMRKTIATFAKICKYGKSLLQPQEFGQSRYNSENVKEAIKIVKDKIGYVDAEEDEINTFGYTNMPEVIKLIKNSIEHVITMMVQYPLRDFSDMKSDALVINELFGKTMSVSSELKAFLKKLSDDEAQFLQKTEISMQQTIRDPQLAHGFFGTPPIAINTKESEDLSMLHMPFGRLGIGRDVTRMNISQQRTTLQMSQRELFFSPKLERSILAPPPAAMMKQPTGRPKKRQFQINSASLFASKPPSHNISRLESYSMVMPASANVLSSTVLDQTMKNPTPPSAGTKSNSRRSVTARRSIVAETPLSPLHETQIPKNTATVNNSTNLLTPQPKRMSINTLLSPKIQLNDQTLGSPTVRKSINLQISKSASPSSRINPTAGRPMLSSNSSLLEITKRSLITDDDPTEDSPTTAEALSKFNKMNLMEEKENLFDTSDAMLVDDSF
ncbi:augmin complex subunit dgt6 [Culicoides brevitarsis]|uniref:augmin complex subunit dgt6 n=1 Tax=Culicoides brevitarsis TaxID=469753 RepID=UPI00307B908A